MEYTFTSNDPEKFNEVLCPINYTGCSVQLRWYVSAITGTSSIVLLDHTDYVIIDYGDEILPITLSPTTTITSLDNAEIVLSEIFNKAGIMISKWGGGRYRFTYDSTPWAILGMSTRMKYVTGFYYMDNVEVVSGLETFNIDAKAVPFNYLTPVWYGISNLGTPVQVPSLSNKWKINYLPTVSRIINYYSDNQNISFSNSDYQSTSTASALSNLKITLLDANLENITFLNPILITITVEEVPLDESLQEAMNMMEPDARYLNLIKTKYQDNVTKLMMKISAVSQGVSVEPQYEPFPEKPEINQPKKENKIIEESYHDNPTPDGHTPPEQTPVVYSNPDTEKNDDRTEEKENGMIEKQEQEIDKEDEE